MGAFPSGQRGQTVNLLSTTSVVRIHPLPPRRSKLCIACSDLFYKSERAHAAAPPLQTGPAIAGLRFGSAASQRFCLTLKNIDFNRPFPKTVTPSGVAVFLIPAGGDSKAGALPPAGHLYCIMQLVLLSKIEHMFEQWL